MRWLFAGFECGLMQAKVFRLPMAHPGDVSALDRLISEGSVRAGEIVAVIGKTEGNGGVNDFTRGYFTQSLMGLLGKRLGKPPEDLARRIPCVLSGGTEGVLSPHYVVLARSSMAPPAPLATWAQTSATTAGWFSWFLPLLAWLTSTIRRWGRPALARTSAAAATLAAS